VKPTSTLGFNLDLYINVGLINVFTDMICVEVLGMLVAVNIHNSCNIIIKSTVLLV